MSESAPKLTKGDKVRIMDTETAQVLGLANRQGTYLGDDQGQALVCLRTGFRMVAIDHACLMKIERFHHEAK